MGLIAGVDVGGTFTDLLALDPASGALRVAKVPTSLPNQADGVMAAFAAAGVDPAATDLIVHGTTTTTNAVIERRLARTGMVTTEGFRDVLELGRRTRPQAYGMTGELVPVIPRDLRLEVPERMDAQGRVVTPLDEGALCAAFTRLAAAGCEALVIHFLHSYANPAHEERAAALAAEVWPTPFVTVGHRLLAQAREFERGVTAALNAGVQPVLARYLGRLSGDLAAAGHRRELLLVNGNGGLVPARAAAREAVRTVMSGPASGVIAAAETGRQAGLADLVTFDMGGTSTDVAVIRGGAVPVADETELGYGLPVHLPMVDVRSVGAGGGSVARVDAGGLLRIGPESAGSVPGPVAAGRGGTRPTVTDANLVLGRLPAGRFPAPLSEVRAALGRAIGRPLGLDPEAAAEAVLTVAEAQMAGAIRLVLASLGADPRDLALFAFGGAGPLHAAALARDLAIPRVLVPARPGLTNALGCLAADLRHDRVQAVGRPLAALDPEAVHAALARAEAECRRRVAAAGAAVEGVEARFAAGLQFPGQTHVLPVPLPDARPTVPMMQAAFEAAYRARFRVDLPEIPARLVSLSVTVAGRRPRFDLARLADPAARAASVEGAMAGRRPVRFAGAWHDTPVFDRLRLPAGARLEGPAILEQMDTTVVIPPGDRAEADRLGNLVLTPAGAP